MTTKLNRADLRALRQLARGSIDHYSKMLDDTATMPDGPLTASLKQRAEQQLQKHRELLAKLQELGQELHDSEFNSWLEGKEL